ncbi:MAG TPA: hypothetical protein VFN37_01695 [Candidatus Baltobacteraceae bacterium]|nr:hypothetical protein [Candidatus Baltobacteraceae bacterium]
MIRNDFLALGMGAFASTLFPLEALAWQPYAVLPAARAGLWVRYIMGFGVPYQKQVGFGIERTPIAERYFIETQVGMPGGSCNPNTMKKAYLRTRTFGNLTQVYGVQAYVSRSSTLVMLDEDQPPPLRLLDSVHLYPKGGGTITKQGASTVSVPRQAVHQSENSIAVQKTAVACTQCAARFDDPLLKELELWTSSNVPLGVGKMRARVSGMPPFELTIDSYGFDFHTGITESLEAVRAQQS